MEGSLVTLVGEIKEQLQYKEPDVPLIARFPHLAVMWGRYQILVTKIEKTAFLSEVCYVTKLNRSNLNRLMKQPVKPKVHETSLTFLSGVSRESDLEPLFFMCFSVSQSLTLCMSPHIMTDL